MKDYTLANTYNKYRAHLVRPEFGNSAGRLNPKIQTKIMEN